MNNSPKILKSNNENMKNLTILELENIKKENENEIFILELVKRISRESVKCLTCKKSLKLNILENCSNIRKHLKNHGKLKKSNSTQSIINVVTEEKKIILDKLLIKIICEDKSSIILTVPTKYHVMKQF
jgi:hypothetical protein